MRHLGLACVLLLAACAGQQSKPGVETEADSPPNNIRCPVPVHYAIPDPNIPYFCRDCGGPPPRPDDPKERAFAQSVYERAKRDVLDPRFPADDDFKRAYLLIWQDWAARRSGAPAVKPSDRAWFWRYRCAPGTYKRIIELLPESQ